MTCLLRYAMLLCSPVSVGFTAIRCYVQDTVHAISLHAVVAVVAVVAVSAI